MGKSHEEHIAKVLQFDNSHRSPSSGASFRDPVDVRTDHFVIEAESTSKQSYRITRNFWMEARLKAYGGRFPAIATRFIKDGERTLDLITLELDDLAELLRNYVQTLEE